jgi:hypothetical protein
MVDKLTLDGARRVAAPAVSRGGRVESARKDEIAFRVRQINPTGKSPKVCPALPIKIFPLPRRANQVSNSARLVATRGALAIVTTCSGMRWM